VKMEVFDSKSDLGNRAAQDAAAVIRPAIAERGRACIVAATGLSQLEFLETLLSAPDIDWKKTVFFHLDEYIGISGNHPASFRRYLRERIIDRVSVGTFHLINGEAPDPVQECRRLGALISAERIDIAFSGIGENGHLAFNDPPADFQTEEPYIVVELDEACRRQQVGEGWFASMDEVPKRAISMSIKQILKAGRILCMVPDKRKAQAVRDCFELEVSPLRPASILQHHPGTTVYLDRNSASLLKDQRRYATRG
jgi:glucosamine-6-phosphate deaminase